MARPKLIIGELNAYRRVRLIIDLHSKRSVPEALTGRVIPGTKAADFCGYGVNSITEHRGPLRIGWMILPVVRHSDRYDLRVSQSGRFMPLPKFEHEICKGW